MSKHNGPIGARYDSGSNQGRMAPDAEKDAKSWLPTVLVCVRLVYVDDRYRG